MSREAEGAAAADPGPALVVPDPAGPAPDPRPRRVLMGGAVALGRSRLRGTRGARLGLAAAIAITLVYGLTIVVIRVEDGPRAALDGALEGAARWLAWLSAGPVALAAAHDRAAEDRRDGIEALAASRGVPLAGMEAARAVAAMQLIALRIGAPAAGLALLGALLAGGGAALRFAAIGVAVALFAAVSGVTVGGLAAMSGRAAGMRGRTLLAGIVLVPWALADLAGNPRWSIPGALDAFLELAVRSAGGAA